MIERLAFGDVTDPCVRALRMAEEFRPLSDLREGDELRGVLRVVRKAFPLSRSGKHYLAVTLGDRSGEIEGRAFDDDAPRLEPKVPSHGYVRVQARAEPYKGR